MLTLKIISFLQMLAFSGLKPGGNIQPTKRAPSTLPQANTVNRIWSSALASEDYTPALSEPATSRENLSSGVWDQVRLKPACSATETS